MSLEKNDILVLNKYIAQIYMHLKCVNLLISFSELINCLYVFFSVFFFIKVYSIFFR